MARRILIADDHKSAREAVADLIQSLGEDWQVCWKAENGRAAVKIATEAKPDLVILDIRMPDMDGIRAGREIHKRDPQLPILFYSLFATPDMDSAARKEGFQGAVAKPDTAGLLEAIRRILEPKNSGEDRSN